MVSVQELLCLQPSVTLIVFSCDNLSAEEGAFCSGGDGWGDNACHTSAGTRGQLLWAALPHKYGTGERGPAVGSPFCCLRVKESQSSAVKAALPSYQANVLSVGKDIVRKLQQAVQPLISCLNTTLTVPLALAKTLQLMLRTFSNNWLNRVGQCRYSAHSLSNLWDHSDQAPGNFRPPGGRNSSSWWGHLPYFSFSLIWLVLSSSFSFSINKQETATDNEQLQEWL